MVSRWGFGRRQSWPVSRFQTFLERLRKLTKSSVRISVDFTEIRIRHWHTASPLYLSTWFLRNVSGQTGHLANVWTQSQHSNSLIIDWLTGRICAVRPQTGLFAVNWKLTHWPNYYNPAVMYLHPDTNNNHILICDEERSYLSWKESVF
jgi:hypothetical protein